MIHCKQFSLCRCPVPTIKRIREHLAILACVPLLFSGRVAQAQVERRSPVKIILDTDIGDDIDDAYALALLVSLPNVKLLGVTTTFGQTQERAELAARFLNVMGHADIPVYAGRRGDAKIRRQYEWARGFASHSLKSEEAVAFLKKALEQNPGEITLVGIGPLINYSDLLTRYPEVRSKIKRIVIMGGSVYVGYNNQPPTNPEWNIKADPAAARTVFESGVPLTMAGLEVTTMMKLDEERQKTLFSYGTPASDALAALTNIWGGHVPTLYDVVAAAYAAGYSFADTEMQHVVVEADGTTRITPGTPNAAVLVHPRKDAFLDWYVQSLKPAARTAPPALHSR